MNRPTPRRLEPGTARKKIAAAKSNEPFMAALLDRDHRGHQDAVDQWSRLHQAAFPTAERRTAAPVSILTNKPARQGPASIKIDEVGAAVSDGGGALTGEYRGSSAQQGRRPVRTAADQIGSVRQRQIDESSPQAEEDDERAAIRDGVLPDPARPLDVQPSVLQPLRRRDRESHEDWLGRLQAELPKAADDVGRLLVIREAILREIGFYDLGTGEVPEGWAMSRSDWAALAALQNVPEDGWRGAQQYSRAERDTFEQVGELPLFGVVGPDGNIYHRLTIDGFHPIGDRLRVVNAFIRTAKPHPPNIEAALATMAMMGAVGSPGKGVAPRLPMSAFAVPAAARYIRANRIAIGAGLVAAGAAEIAIRGAGRSDMDAAPDLPPAPGLEPPERPDTGRESLPADLPPIPPLPGFMPEDYADLVEIFPDQRGDLPLVDILDNRWGSPETQLFNTETMRGVRDLADAMGVEVWHRGGGRPDNESDYEKEHWLRGAGGGTAGSSYLDIAFESKQTERKLLINTVDTRADNVTLTGREEGAAVRILRNSETGDILVTLAKPPRGHAYDLERFLEWIRPLVEEIDRDLLEGSEGHQRRFDFR